MADCLEEQMYTRPPLPPPLWQWLCIVVIIVGVVFVWLLRR
jgi:hypothetical protein